MSYCDLAGFIAWIPKSSLRGAKGLVAWFEKSARCHSRESGNPEK
ncbi:hypothetical protein [Rickettsia tamurae]|nr:hypothetical protein [Rickettsia tamurae]